MRLKFPSFIKRRGFAGDRQGATAVEFAIVGPVFLGLLGAIAETALVMLSSQALEQAVSVAGRSIMVGKVGAQLPANKETYFKNVLCTSASWLLNCNDILYDVRAYDQFSNADLSRPVVNGVFNQTGLPRFQPGTANQIVVVRAYYKRPVYLDKLGSHLSYVDGGYYLVVATSVFKNEP